MPNLDRSVPTKRKARERGSLALCRNWWLRPKTKQILEIFLIRLRFVVRVRRSDSLQLESGEPELRFKGPSLSVSFALMALSKTFDGSTYPECKVSRSSRLEICKRGDQFNVHGA